jgi:hypothetical protein
MANVENHSYPLTGFTRSSREMPGVSYEDVNEAEIKKAQAQENLVGLIRDVMQDQEGRGSPGRRDKIRTKGARLSLHRLVPRFKRSNVSRQSTRQQIVPEIQTAPPKAGIIVRVLSFLWGMLWRLLKPLYIKLKAYRPTSKHFGFAAFAAVIIMRPWLILLAVFILAMLAGITWLTLGPDRAGEIVQGAWLRLRAFKPQQADDIRHSYETGVKQVNQKLSRVQGRWLTPLDPQDFSDEQANLDMRPDPFDRLAAEPRQHPKADKPAL